MVERKKDIGRGSFGVVYHGFYNPDTDKDIKDIDIPRNLAIKVVKSQDSQVLKKLQAEC